MVFFVVCRFGAFFFELGLVVFGFIGGICCFWDWLFLLVFVWFALCFCCFLGLVYQFCICLG